MKTLFPVATLYIEIIQLRLIILKYDFLIGFYSSLGSEESNSDRK